MAFPYRAIAQASGIIVLTILLLRRLPDILLRASFSPLFVVNVTMVSILLVVYLWRQHGSSIYVSVFHGTRELIQAAPAVLRAAMQSFKAAHSVLTRASHKPWFCRAIFCLLVQSALVPSYYLAWLQSLVAFHLFHNVLRSAAANVHRVTPDQLHRLNLPLIGPIQFDLSVMNELVAKSVFTFAVINLQFLYVSKMYLFITVVYEILYHRLLEMFITQKLLSLDIEMLEGLDGYIVRVLYNIAELLLSVLFILILLVKQYQLLPLLALYIIVGCRVQQMLLFTITPLVAEWGVIAQLQWASEEELANHDDVCPVCLSKMRLARKTPCGHYFHGRCLRECLRDRLTCPMCFERLNLT